MLSVDPILSEIKFKLPGLKVAYSVTGPRIVCSERMRTENSVIRF